MPDFIQQFDQEPQFWQFLNGLHETDLLVELIQNELDANASHTTITFYSGRLLCTGDGDSVDENGWARLRFLMGAGVQVEAKQSSIGIKNHGMNACFRIGDQIVVRSDGHKTIQTLYKDGPSKKPSPGAWDVREPDEDAPLRGCSIEIPYRTKPLRISAGEASDFSPTTPNTIRNLFMSACNELPTRLMGVVRSGPESWRSQYTLTLKHHTLGSIEMHWRAKRGQARRRGQRRFTLFSRECHVTSSVQGLESQTIREQACLFRIHPQGDTHNIANFFAPDKRSFVGEVAWQLGNDNSPKAVQGIRRYPIAYDSEVASALTGTGVHFSGAYRSGAERHGATQSDWNEFIDAQCKSALVDIMAAHLLPRYGGKAMELYLGDPKVLEELVRQTIQKRALPLRVLGSPSGKVRSGQEKRRSRNKSFVRYELGPKKRANGEVRRVVLPMFTWEDGSISQQLSFICPHTEDQIDPTIPSEILRSLQENISGSLITFDEDDAIQRLQPQSDAKYFPWRSDGDWQAALSNTLITRKYLDVVLDAIQNNKLPQERSIAQNAYLPDSRSVVRPLAEMHSGVNLPEALQERAKIHFLHSDLAGHPVFKRAAWKPARFTLADYLERARFETALLEHRRAFWKWFQTDGRNHRRDKALGKVADLPVWPTTRNSFVELRELCAPSDRRTAAILGNVIRRPALDVLKLHMVKTSGNGRFVIRSLPSEEEIEAFLSARLETLPRERPLISMERGEFQKFEKDLDFLASISEIKKMLIDMSNEYAIALGQDGYLRRPSELIRSEGAVARLHLPERYILDRAQKSLDKLKGWGPRENPSSAQIADALREDVERIDAHVPRFQSYLEQADREGIEPDGIREIHCLPLEGGLHAPASLVLPNRPDYWGAQWKNPLPVEGINPETLKIYGKIGVVGRMPSRATSLAFFQWLAEQRSNVIVKHIDQILRHINHNAGPLTWHFEYPDVPFIPAMYRSNEIQLVTLQEALSSRMRVIIPDFDLLEQAIRSHSAQYPIGIAVVESSNVNQPISAELRKLELRALSDVVGAPKRVLGSGQRIYSHSLMQILKVLLSSSIRNDLSKRFERLRLDPREAGLRRNWHEHLSQIQEIVVIDEVRATYRVSRSNVSVSVRGQYDRQSKALYIRAISDTTHLEDAFFESIADLMFESPKPYLGGVLRQAISLSLPQRATFDLSEGESLLDEENEEKEDITAAGGTHSPPTRDPQANIPKPGPIPVLSRTSAPKTKKGGSSTGRPQAPVEDAHISDLKENQYAWHCQACLSNTASDVLAPEGSYVEPHQNRQRVIEAHHCDQVSAGGARHAGNLLILCHYHHLEIGDAVSRREVTSALAQAADHTLTFQPTGVAPRSHQGKLVTVSPSQRTDPIRLFFTTYHADYWLEKAREEGEGN